MEAICVVPHDERHKLRLEAMNIKKKFIDLGFNNRSGFLGLVSDNFKEYGNYEGVKVLLNWWLLRLADKELNDRLDKLADNLKAE